jgi:hypothetical protein
MCEARKRFFLKKEAKTFFIRADAGNGSAP